jgi:DNA-binding MarR family transcriptional regulator
VLGEAIISYSRVRKYVPIFVLSAQDRDTPIVIESDESDGDFSLDHRVALVLSEQPFVSVHQIAEKVEMSKSTVDRHLTQIMRGKL